MSLLVLSLAPLLVVQTPARPDAASAPVGASTAEDTPAPAPEATPPLTRVLVLEPEVAEADVSLKAPLVSAIAAAFGGHDDHAVVSFDDLKTVINAQAMREATGCTDDDACLAKVTEKLNADLVVRARVGNVGENIALSLSVQKPSTVETVGTASTEARDLGALLEQIPDLVARAMGWSEATEKARFELPEGKTLSMAFLPLSSTGVDDATVANLSELMATEFKQVDGLSVIGMADVRALIGLEAEKQILGCSDDSCLAEVGDALGVDKLVSGEVGKVGDRYIIGLRLVDREKVAVDARVSETFSGPEEQLVRAVKRAARRLVGIASDDPGALAITTNQAGAKIFIDGDERGTVPGPPIDGLAPGPHAVRISASGFYDWQGDIYVEPAETTPQYVVLDEEPRLVRPFLPEWAYWGGWIGVGGLGAATSVAGIASAVTIASYYATRAGDNGVVDGRLLKTNYNFAVASMSATLGGAAATAASAALAGTSTLFVRWEGE